MRGGWSSSAGAVTECAIGSKKAMDRIPVALQDVHREEFFRGHPADFPEDVIDGITLKGGDEIVIDAEGPVPSWVVETLWIHPLLPVELLKGGWNDTKLFPELATERVPGIFPGLELSSGELPFQRVAGAFTPLAGKHTGAVDQDANGDVFHASGYEKWE
jgi:hypothetical protein